jgi:hypothetical protein
MRIESLGGGMEDGTWNKAYCFVYIILPIESRGIVIVVKAGSVKICHESASRFHKSARRWYESAIRGYESAIRGLESANKGCESSKIEPMKVL